MKKFLRTCLLAACCFALGAEAYAQATIRGKVVNGTTGEALLGATVRIMSAGAVKGGAYTDLEGNYTAKAAPGTYDVIISYISFISDTLKGVVANNGEVVYNETLLVEELSVREDLAVEITATRSTTSTVTLYNQKRNSVNAIDGVSFDLIQRTGDNSAAGAVARVVGVTVAEGKFVYVRGLGDRYSKTTLNGAEIPSLDPNRNAVQIDIFPSNLIDNIIVYKNFTPDLPGNFTGGLVDVRTKDFPDRFMLNFSAGLSYNPQANLQDSFLTYPTGTRDWLGVDDGTRALPEYIRNLPNGIPAFSSIRTTDPDYGQKIEQIDRASEAFLRSQMYPQLGSSGLDQNYQLSIGNQFGLFGKPFGFIASVSYRNEYEAYTNGTIGRYKNTGTAADPVTSLTPEISTSRQSGKRDALLGTLLKLSYKPHTNHKFSFNFMHNQSGSSATIAQDGRNTIIDSEAFVEDRVLAYTQRVLDVFQLQGSHVFGKLKAEWIASYADASQEEPDLRFFSNTYFIEPDDNGVPTRFYDIRSSNDQVPANFYRQLDEINVDVNAKFELPIKLGEQTGKIKFGGAYTTKDREFAEQRYEVSFNTRQAEYDGNPDNFFSSENFGVTDTVRIGSTVRYNLGYFYQDVSEARNTYSGEQTVGAGFLMAELPLSSRFKVIAGARYERTNARTVSLDSTLADGILDLNDVLPSLQLIYSMKENMNLRGGYSRTLARPSFREFTPFVSFDFVGDFVLVGNTQLERTLIDNFDLRWEWFPTPAELFSVSVFAKNFTNPIERILDLRAPNPEFTFRNIEAGLVYGVELEAKKNFAFISEGLRKLELGGNLTLVRSEVELTEQEYQTAISVDPERSRTRPLYNQSPYTANVELSYIDNEKLGLQASVSYNVFGQRLTLVGIGEPDVYEQPRGLLNVSLSKTLGSRLSIRLRANNLLNPAYRQVYEYRDVQYEFESFRLGSSYSATLSVKI